MEQQCLSAKGEFLREPQGFVDPLVTAKMSTFASSWIFYSVLKLRLWGSLGAHEELVEMRPEGLVLFVKIWETRKEGDRRSIKKSIIHYTYS